MVRIEVLQDMSLVSDSTRPFIVDKLVTQTSIDQNQVTETCGKYLNEAIARFDSQSHIEYLKKGVEGLSRGYIGLDASQPWLLYWIFNSLSMLNEDLTPHIDPVAERLKLLRQSGAFGGGYQQTAHLAATYAAVSAISLFQSSKLYDLIDREALLAWLLSLKQPSGGFRMSLGGEEDVRAVYCALSVASLCDILHPDLIKGTAEWLAKCQTFEGGLSGSHGVEAHGGYAFCVLAALTILEGLEGIPRYLDVPRLVRWLSSQQTHEGGFSGRTNKLVDGCYSWWVGGCWPLLMASLRCTACLWDKSALQKYILNCTQVGSGGLRDKPDKYPDYYHTCYCLAGLSITEYEFAYGNNHLDWSNTSKNPHPLVSQLNPVFVTREGCAKAMHDYFAKSSSSHTL